PQVGLAARGTPAAVRPAASASLPRLRGVDGGLPGAQQVAAPQLGDVRVAEAAAAQFGGDVRGFGRVHPAGQSAATVEVGGDADVVDAGDLDHVHDVVHVLGHRGQRVLALDR